jgi:phage/plasmid-like protein (TIGR03299 family)
MPDGITETDTMFAYRDPPWHGKGIVVDNALTAAEAIVAAGLGWHVSLVPIIVDGRPVHGYMATVRDDIDTVLGVVGDRYRPFQNDQLFSFFDPVVSRENGAWYHTGGSIHGGKKVWLLAKVPGDFYVAGMDDVIENYILLCSSHDGTMKIVAKSTPIRVVCQNTLAMALGNSKSMVAIKHTENAEVQLRLAHQVLGLATRQSELLKLAAQFLLEKPIDARLLNNFLSDLLPTKKENALVTNNPVMRYRQRIEDLFTDSPTNNMPGMHGTGWGLYNAVSEWADHEKPIHRGTDSLDRTWFGSGEELKLKAFDILMK